MNAPPSTYRATRLRSGDGALAKKLFSTMAEVFEEESEPLGGEYIQRLLARDDLWVIAAMAGEEIVGGATAHVLPMTRSESREVFIYDIAVRASHQRRGVGRLIVSLLRGIAREEGIDELFVPADDEDVHALDFYRALGGVAAPVTFFTFRGTGREQE